MIAFSIGLLMLRLSPCEIKFNLLFLATSYDTMRTSAIRVVSNDLSNALNEKGSLMFDPRVGRALDGMPCVFRNETGPVDRWT